MRKDIVVLGSLNVDFVVKCARRPGPGETVQGSLFQVFPGGKGANQAVAASRAGGKVTMAGRIGDDLFSDIVQKSLLESGVRGDKVKRTPETATGSAFITLDLAGENSIVVVPGANGKVSKEDVDEIYPTLQSSKVLLLQMEIPLDVVVYAAQRAHEAGCMVLLDPAPPASLPDEIWTAVDVILPNEHEASFLTGRTISDLRTARLAAADLVSMGARSAVVKLGSRGCVMAQNNSIDHVAGFPVDQVDSTAAGDTFAGAFAVSLCEGRSTTEALRFANAAAAISVTRMGAQSSMPWREEIDSFLYNH